MLPLLGWQGSQCGRWRVGLRTAATPGILPPVAFVRPCTSPSGTHSPLSACGRLLSRTQGALKAHLAAQGSALPGYVEREFEAYLKCGRLEHGFLRLRCGTCHAEHPVGVLPQFCLQPQLQFIQCPEMLGRSRCHHLWDYAVRFRQV